MMHPRVCYEGDGGAGGGGFFDSIKNLFSSGTEAVNPGVQSPLSIGELSPEQISGLQQSVSGPAAGGFDIPVDTGGQAPAPTGFDIPIGSTPSPLPTTTPTVSPATSSQAVPSLEGPGGGTGAVAGPGGGAAATAAPATLGGDDARFAAGGGLNKAPGFTDAVARNTGLDPSAVRGSAGTGTGTSVDTAIADPSLRNILKAAGANANILVPAAGLAYQAGQTQKAPEGLDQIRSAAAQTGAQSAIMQKYLTDGTLPPGLRAGLDQAREAAKASIRSRYANLPGSSSAMEQELANADQVAAAQGGQLAIQLFQQGMTEANVSNQLYEAILQQSLERDKELSGAVSNFATAMAGGGPSLKLSLG